MYIYICSTEITKAFDVHDSIISQSCWWEQGRAELSVQDTPLVKRCLFCFVLFCLFIILFCLNSQL